MKKELLFSFAFIGEIGFATALPLVVFGLLGRYLDKLYQTSPYMFLLGILIASIQIFFYLKMIIEKAKKNISKV